MSAYEYRVCTHCDTGEVVVEWREGENFREAKRDRRAVAAAVLAVAGVGVAAALVLGPDPPYFYASLPYPPGGTIDADIGVFMMIVLLMSMLMMFVMLMSARQNVDDWRRFHHAPEREAARAVLDVEPTRSGAWSCRVVPDADAAGITRAWYAKKQQWAEGRSAREQETLQRCAEEEGGAHVEAE